MYYIKVQDQVYASLYHLLHPKPVLLESSYQPSVLQWTIKSTKTIPANLMQAASHERNSSELQSGASYKAIKKDS